MALGGGLNPHFGPGSLFLHDAEMEVIQEPLLTGAAVAGSTVPVVAASEARVL
jgi:hypothetical protein